MRGVIHQIAESLGVDVEAAALIRSAAIRALEADRVRAAAASAKAAQARAALPPGSSRARVTSANAKWMRHAEALARIDRALEGLGVVHASVADAARAGIAAAAQEGA